MTEFKGIDEIIEPFRIKKPWYWPVTTTIYKMGLGFILTVGIYTLLDYVWPYNIWPYNVWHYNDEAQAIVAGLLAMNLYLALWKRKDWL